MTNKLTIEVDEKNKGNVEYEGKKEYLVPMIAKTIVKLYEEKSIDEADLVFIISTIKRIL